MSKLDQSICRMLDAICGTMVRAQASHKVTGFECLRIEASRANLLARPFAAQGERLDSTARPLLDQCADIMHI